MAAAVDLKHDVSAALNVLIPPLYFLAGCRRDKDGYFWVTGRIDDMLNVSGKTRPSCYTSV